MQTNPTDEVLVERILLGDKPAFRMLVARYQNLVFTMALRITGGREDAEETAQDVFMKVYANLGSFSGQSKFSTWLYSIVYHTALSKIRKQRPEISSLDQEKTADALSKAGAVYNNAEQTLGVEYVSKAIGMLAPDDAAIISMFYLAEQHIDEIALALAIAPNTAKVRLHRARKKLRELLNDN